MIYLYIAKEMCIFARSWEYTACKVTIFYACVFSQILKDVNKVESNLQQEVRNAVEVLRRGGVILYPTDTIWGLGCDATNAEAVERIYAIKQRDLSKSLLVLADSVARVEAFVEELPPIAWDLIEVSSSPLTIIYPKGKNLAPNVLASDGSVGIRVTSEAFSKALCEAFHAPIVSTSANFSGQPSPANFREISDELLQCVDYVVDYRRDDVEKKRPSSVIKLMKNGTFAILRK